MLHITEYHYNIIYVYVIVSPVRMYVRGILWFSRRYAEYHYNIIDVLCNCIPRTNVRTGDTMV